MENAVTLPCSINIDSAECIDPPKDARVRQDAAS
jgi:hypothetical protein